VKISIDSVVVASDNHLACTVGSETVILHSGAGLYFGFNELASFIWQHIQQPTPVCQILDAVQLKYEVSRAKAESDLLMLIQELERTRLVVVR
jgi:hypothetical protein